jgi:hypothetical protein
MIGSLLHNLRGTKGHKKAAWSALATYVRPTQNSTVSKARAIYFLTDPLLTIDLPEKMMYIYYVRWE